MNKQQQAISRIRAGDSIFLTGAGGRGKSWVIDQLRDETTVVAAPTGIAALNVQGLTCHSLFGLPIGLPHRSDTYKISEKFRKVFGRHSPVETIIIDEVGTLRADYLDLIDRKLRVTREDNRPWGGLQVAVVGDLFQLGPIVAGKEREHFYKKYHSPFPFAAEAWCFDTIELDINHRQKDPMHDQVLESIRRADADLADAMAIVNTLSARAHIEGSLRLCSYNADADRVNAREYAKVDGAEFAFPARVHHNWGKDEPVPRDLKLKVGCQVLLCANHGGYVNGDRGVVEHLDVDKIIVRKMDGVLVDVKPNTWEKMDYTDGEDGLQREVTATYIQFPIRLGWAVSVHKSQGMTLDGVTIDVGRGCFAHGQFYVALSRCKNLERVNFITQPTMRDVRVDPEVTRFYDELMAKR